MVAILKSLQYYVPTVPENELCEVAGSEPFNLVKNRIHKIKFGESLAGC